MEVSQALLQHALDIGHAYKSNLAMHHGLEKPERIVIDKLNGATPQQETPPQPTINVMAPAPAAQSFASKIGPWLVAASMATGGVGLGAAAATWLAKPQPATPIAIPTSPQSTGDDHLLSDLQERGFHLPKRGAK